MYQWLRNSHVSDVTAIESDSSSANIVISLEDEGIEEIQENDNPDVNEGFDDEFRVSYQLCSIIK